MTLPIANLLASVASAGNAEVSEALVAGQGIRLERIVSLGHASPEGFWYDQKEAEWVVLLAGRAGLRLAQEPAERVLGPGDALYLPAGCLHRVTWTDPHQPTVWLALFVDAQLCPLPCGPMTAGKPEIDAGQP